MSMTTETKYNAGDTVWFTYDTTEPYSGQIINIEQWSHGVQYIISFGRNRISREEARLHPSEADCYTAMANHHQALAETYRDRANALISNGQVAG